MMKKKRNPYRNGGDYWSLFNYMQKNQTFTRKGLLEFCMNKLHLSPKQALYNVNILNSPREKSRKGSDPRGSVCAKGHLYFCEPLERKWVAGIRQPQYFRLRWRKMLLKAKRRENNYVAESEKIVERTENILKRVKEYHG
jgi:hypothetical protein